MCAVARSLALCSLTIRAWLPQVVAINFSEKSSFSLELSGSDLQSGQQSGQQSGLQSGQQWQLRGQPHADRIFFNDEPLIYDVQNGGLPELHPKSVSSLQLPPCSVTFVEFDS